MPLCGISCVAFRDFQVQPFQAAPSQPVTISILVEDYRKVSETTRSWAIREGLVEEPCRYYSYSSPSKARALVEQSPGCHLFSGSNYYVRTDFTPNRNATKVSILGAEHSVVEDVGRRLQKYLGAEFGASSISEAGGGEMPAKCKEASQ